MATYFPRFFKPPGQSFFLFGPRGTGKTTFLRHHFPDALWIDLLRPEVHRRYLARPERLRELTDARPGQLTVVIDEVQKAPNLLPVVHGLIEERQVGKEEQKLRFVLTGSSARKLKKTGVNLLAGRALYKTFHPFLFSELPFAYPMEKALRFGMLPLVLQAPEPEQTLDAYVSLYIREEVQYEGLVRHAGHFSRFLEAVSFSHGQLLNLSNVARDCEVNRKTVENYVQILEDVLLAFKLPSFGKLKTAPFNKKAKRKLQAHPKFYFFDTGVFHTLRPKGPLDKPEEIAGAALEGLVAQQLRAWNACNSKPFNLYFWRSRSGLEVDFILYGEKGFYAIEVKNSAKLKPEHLKSLNAFKKDHPQAQTLLLYRGSERLKIQGHLCLPCETFFAELLPDRPPI